MAKERMQASKDKGGAILTAWRDSMGYSLTDAATALGMPESDLASLEKAGTQPPRYIRLAMGALALGITPEGENQPGDMGEM